MSNPQRHPPVDVLAAMENRRTKANEFLAKRRKQFDEDLREVMSRPAGRSLVHRILSECGLWSIISSPRGDELNQILGRRNLAVGYYRSLKRVCPDFVDQMEKEHLGEFKALEDLET